MTQQRTLTRRIIYVAIIAVLLVPLYMLGNPETKRSSQQGGEQGGSGGYLAQLRNDKENPLAETNLGEIDPASGAARLCTFGMRGVAVALLWQKAQDYQKRKLWMQLKATTEQIMHLEPHFVEVWQNQAWNLAYNVSAEFDDYRERYRWVKEGIELGAEGCDYNRHSAVLPWYVGWVISQKIGRADEKKQFRRLFREDDEFHSKFGTPTRELRDNWLLGKEWYREAENLYQNGASIGKKSIVIFYSRRPMCQMNHAEAIEEEGEFGERAREQWRRAERDWEEYGNRTIPSTTPDRDGNIIKIALNDYIAINNEVEQKETQLREIQPGLFDAIRWEKWQALSPQEQASLREALLPEEDASRSEILNFVRARLEKENPDWREQLAETEKTILNEQQREALATTEMLRTPQQQVYAEQGLRELDLIRQGALKILTISNNEVAERIEDDTDRAIALQLAREIDLLNAKARIVNSYRDLVSYNFWMNTARGEQTQEIREARSLWHEAVETYYAGSPLEANGLYLAGLTRWKEAMDKYEFMQEDDHWEKDLLERVSKYVVLLDNIDELFPEDFVLQDMIHEAVTEHPSAEAARTAVAQAEAAIDQGDHDAAREALEVAVVEWNSLLVSFEFLKLMADPRIGEEILETIGLYADLLRSRDSALPESFPLSDFSRNILRHDPLVTAARKHGREAYQRLNASEHPQAQAEFELALADWAEVLDRFPAIYIGFEPEIQQEIERCLAGYIRVLELRGQEMPEDMPVMRFIEVFGLPAGG